MTRSLRSLFCTVVIGGLAVAVASKAFAAETNPRCEDVPSIGVAHMEPDGTITLQVHSLPPGPIAESFWTYAPSDKNYASMLKHVGEMKPGEDKPVPPWC